MTVLLRHSNCFQRLDAASESKVKKRKAPSLHAFARASVGARKKSFVFYSMFLGMESEAWNAARTPYFMKKGEMNPQEQRDQKEVGSTIGHYRLAPGFMAYLNRLLAREGIENASLIVEEGSVAGMYLGFERIVF